MLVFVPHTLKRALMGKVAGEKPYRRITLANRAKPVKLGEAFEGHFFEADFRIQGQWRLQFLRFKAAPGQFV